MMVTALECLHADAGIRTLDFLKISTDEGLVGWSEYNEAFGGKGVTSAIENLAPLIVGRVFAFVMTGLNVGAAITPVLFSSLLDHGASQIGFVLMAAFALAVTGIAVLVNAAIAAQGTKPQHEVAAE